MESNIMNEEYLKDWLRGLESNGLFQSKEEINSESFCPHWSHRKEHTHIIAIHRFVQRMEKAYTEGWKSVGTLTANGRGLHFMRQEMQLIIKELEERGY